MRASKRWGPSTSEERAERGGAGLPWVNASRTAGPEGSQRVGVGCFGVLLVSILWLGGCAHHRTAPERALTPGQIVDASLRQVEAEELRESAREASYVLVGERHDDRCDHEVEAAVVRLLGEHGTWAVGLEMVAVDQTPILERFSAGELPLEELPSALDWEANWGVDFRAYEPIFAAAQDTGTPVAALNLPRQVVRALGQGELDPVPEALRPFTVPEVIPVGEEELAFLRDAYAAHGHADERSWERFLFVQALWDSQMAFRAVQVHRALGRGVIVIAGTGHVWNGWGIAKRLAVFDPEAKVLSLTPWRGGEPPDPVASDWFFYCPG